MAHAYPILLDVTDLFIVIIGGGAVAARKANGLIVAKARRIRCVSPVFHDDIPPVVERIAEQYADNYLDGAELVFACTDDPDVNRAVVRDARTRGIFVNRADSDDSDPGDFSTPAKLEDGAVIIAVSAASPALSAMIRDDLACKLDRRFVAMADAMRTLRPEIRSSRLDIAMRAKLFRDLVTDDALNTLQAGGIAALRGWLLKRYPELHHE